MIELKLTKERKARVWFDDFPPVLPDADKREFSRPLDGPVVAPAHQRCVLELLVPLGGPFNHGLLGCSIDEHMPEASVIVDASQQRTQPFVGPLAQRVESVYWGLDDEFIDSVFAGAARGIAQFGRPAGQIRFDIAAHGDIGATPSMFSRLAWMLIALVMLPGSDREMLSRHLET